MHKNFINLGYVSDEVGNIKPLELTDNTEEILETENNIELLEKEVKERQAMLSAEKIIIPFCSFIFIGLSLVIASIPFYFALEALKMGFLITGKILIFITSIVVCGLIWKLKSIYSIIKEYKNDKTEFAELMNALESEKNHLEELNKNKRKIAAPEQITINEINCNNFTKLKNDLKVKKNCS